MVLGETLTPTNCPSKKGFLPMSRDVDHSLAVCQSSILVFGVETCFQRDVDASASYFTVNAWAPPGSLNVQGYEFTSVAMTK